MKKLLMICMLALGALAVSSQPASAWTKFRVGIGANISYQGGGNSILWGAFNGSPMPGCMPGCLPPAYGPMGPAGYPVGQEAPTATAANAGPVQPVNYGYGYQPANYYYPTGNFTYYAAPSYWYGR